MQPLRGCKRITSRFHFYLGLSTPKGFALQPRVVVLGYPGTTGRAISTPTGLWPFRILVNGCSTEHLSKQEMNVSDAILH